MTFQSRPVIAGNWKMNKGPADTRAFFEAFANAYAPRTDRSVLVFPPALSFAAAVEATRSRPDIQLGVQNIHWEKSGAFTGEVSAPMAKEAGAAFVLIGHSERRHIFGETDEDCRRKVAAALDAGLIPVLCVGELLEERQAGHVEDVITRQLTAGLDVVPGDAADRILIAYEPVWAIGTGVTATPADAAHAHGVLRGLLARHFGSNSARVPILYGGSVKPDNAALLLSAGNVDGLLVGGASLDPAGFSTIASA